MATLVLERFLAFLLPSLLLKYVRTTDVLTPCEEDLQMVLSQTLSYLNGRSVHFGIILDWALSCFQFTLMFTFLFLPLFRFLLCSSFTSALSLISCPSSSVTASPSTTSFAHAMALCRSFGKEL